MVMVFYFLQNEEGEDQAHPNAFLLPHNSVEEVRFGDILKTFPIANTSKFHFRFRKSDAKFGYIWSDLSSNNDPVPGFNGKIIAKILRLTKPPRTTVRLKRKPVLVSNSSRRVSQTSVGGGLNRSDGAGSNGGESVATPDRPPRPQKLSASARPHNPSDTTVNGSKPAPVPVADPNMMSWDDSGVGKRVGGATPAVAPEPPIIVPEMDASLVGTQQGAKVSAQIEGKSDYVRAGVLNFEAELKRKQDEAVRIQREHDEREEQKRTDREDAQTRLGRNLKEWSEDNGTKKNVRYLLATLHTVLWPGARWKELSMAKLIQERDVKMGYRKAMLVVHPDRNSGADVDPDRLFIADRVFAALNEAWIMFNNEEVH